MVNPQKFTLTVTVNPKYTGNGAQTREECYNWLAAILESGEIHYDYQDGGKVIMESHGEDE